MAITPVAVPYTTAERITDLMGALGLSLRNDDETDMTGDFMTLAVNAGTSDLDFFLTMHLQSDIAASEWAVQHATWFGVRWWCLHRLNELPTGVQLECERREKQLELVRVGKAVAPRIPKSRRPVTTTNYHVDLRPLNNQIRVDTTRSTGVAQGYDRVVDQTAPDER